MLTLPLDGLLPHDSCSAAILMRFDQTTSYAKILDTKALQSDLGLYALRTNLRLYSALPERDSDHFTAQQWHFAGRSDDLLHFFIDDGNSENSAGAVARIRLYPYALDRITALDLDDNPWLIFGDRFETSPN